MNKSTQYRDLLGNTQHPSIHCLVLCTCPAAGHLMVDQKPDIDTILIVVSGMLAIQQDQHSERVLPRETARLDGANAWNLSNPSRSDELEVVIIQVKREHIASTVSNTNLERYYHSDDSKDNKLCLIASNQTMDGVLLIDANVEIFLFCLAKWDSMLFEYQIDNVIAVVLRGSANIEGTLCQALGLGRLANQSPLTITGNDDCEVLAIRTPLASIQ